MPCYATPIARLLELQDRGLPYHESPLPSYPILQLPEGSRCFFALNHVQQKARRIQKVEKFVCVERSQKILYKVDSKEPHDPSPNTVSFYKTQMEMDHTLLTNKQIGFTGLCYTQIETLKSGDLEIPWQD
ncbi:hypothetical protein LENED_010739 [Lentinula edodes]|uniref:Uncharacterized protein n=1 Tax=Lentinula edodes TaxID=5353 RepID=A0A1Q3EN82_LENED|nr:hypothetical protein LENED_010739 [Lentinula edodes]